jgi:hypothetical protein
VTSTDARGAPLFKMMDVSRHKSVDTLRGYVRDADAFRRSCGGRFAVAASGAGCVDPKRTFRRRSGRQGAPSLGYTSPLVPLVLLCLSPPVPSI